MVPGIKENWAGLVPLSHAPDLKSVQELSRQNLRGFSIDSTPFARVRNEEFSKSKEQENIGLDEQMNKNCRSLHLPLGDTP